MLQAIDGLTSVLNDLFRVGGIFSIRVIGDYIFWNDTRLKSDAGSQAVFESVCRELRGGERTEERFEELSVPALVVTAEESPEVLRRCSEALAAALPGARSKRRW